MSLLDNVLVFGKDAVASNLTQFKILDLGVGGRNLSANRHGAGYLNIHVNTAMSGTATTIQLYHGDESSAVNTAIGEAFVLTSKPAGTQISVRLPDGLKRFITVKCSAANTGKLDAFIGPVIAQH